MAKKSFVALSLCAAVALTACATGTKINSDGTVDELKWKSPTGVTFNKDKGTFPDLQSLSQIRTGMTKDQLYYLIGRPQYNDGWRPREWNYVFHFHTPGQGTDDVTTCQYKVVFDKDMFARTFHWNPVDPIDAACPPQAPVEQTQQSRRYTLDADALFAFDQHSTDQMLPEGRAQLDNLASHLIKFDDLRSVRITGHTDRLGGVAYNQTLSERRAETVRQYLIQRGVPARVIFAQGMGKSQQIKACEGKMPRKELIACLQPNRRVEVEVDGSGKLD
ncbi:MAG: OmpA family protein [Neisseriaceae bacterium]|nr:OmpA family protein [Neisseriaceae bacterium]